VAKFEYVYQSLNLGQIQTTKVVMLTELPVHTGSQNAREPKA